MAQKQMIREIFSHAAKLSKGGHADIILQKPKANGPVRRQAQRPNSR